MARAAPLVFAIFLGIWATAVNAGYDNGGTTNFPYCDCVTKFPGACINITGPTISGSTLTFSVSSRCVVPLQPLCTQDIHKVEINSFLTCRHTSVGAYYSYNGNIVVIPTPTFDGDGEIGTALGLQVLKLTQLSITYAQLEIAPVTFTITLGGTNGCPTWNSLLNTTSNPPGVPVAVALFSSDNKCCPLGPLPPPPPPPPPSPHLRHLPLLLPFTTST
ncbi:hypothetical protein CEUSTIGMA_g8637.t1 [Chlamydomonas eustigma]|uniref:Pherophorin domain-containing protein n=1 Tax=Chlamydomonas eustigma TaxID=1157962 RepID=A0A250XDP4_9CHLO|nr:hypothetical protein CEUSTIGMA_g8637.t1 [Chlamydomonas eustigma]|eukprot:GAX81205.1 hypothetical protein CEUSTIGMA_g8637.t1 [Chlamydomonas eustigma]